MNDIDSVMEKWKEDAWNEIIGINKSYKDETIQSIDKELALIKKLMKAYLYDGGYEKMEIFSVVRHKSDPIMYRFMCDFTDVCSDNNILDTDKIHLQILRNLKDSWLQYYEEVNWFWDD